ncbi:caspase family protein, partial [candidate division KSB1 bacterium]|nr:caspase family protein [candidate division KSB1 bacterium]
VPLVPGMNRIEAITTNENGTMESRPDAIRLRCKVEYHKPVMVAVVVGIDQYRNKNISLKYAVSDAQAFADTLNKFACGLFERIDLTMLTTPEETTKEHIIQVFENLKARIPPQDLFVFYNASHGMIDVVEEEEQYLLLTSNILLMSSRHLVKDISLTQGRKGAMNFALRSLISFHHSGDDENTTPNYTKTQRRTLCLHPVSMVSV